MVSQGRKASARSPKAIRVSKRISKKVPHPPEKIEIHYPKPTAFDLVKVTKRKKSN